MTETNHALDAAAAGPAGAVAASTPHAAHPRSFSPRPRKLRVLRWVPAGWIFSAGATDRQVLHLTFDDGPHPDHTPRMLDLLAAHDAKSTFFVIGSLAERHPALLRRIVEAGHALGNHSWSHPRFEQVTGSRQLEEIERTDRLLQAHDGLARHDFRPPHGTMPPRMLLDAIRRRRRIVHWSYDTFDYSQRPVDDLVAIARSHPMRSGDVVLLHDDSAHSHGLLATMLPEWRGQGYAFECLPGRGAAAGGRA